MLDELPQDGAPSAAPSPEPTAPEAPEAPAPSPAPGSEAPPSPPPAAAGSPTPTAAVPPEPAAPSEFDQAYGYLREQAWRVQEWERQLQQAAALAQTELDAAKRYGGPGAYDEAKVAYEAREAQRQAALALIEAERQKLTNQWEAVQLAQQQAAWRQRAEPTSRQILLHEQHQRARQQLGAAYDEHELNGLLGQETHPPALERLTDHHIAMKRKYVAAQRQANGTDHMGGGGGAVPTDPNASAAEDFAAWARQTYHRR